MILTGCCSLNSKFESFRDEALNGGVLAERERVLAALVASMAYDSPGELRKWVIKAKQIGISQEEMGQLAAICLSVHRSKLDFLDQADETGTDVGGGSNCCV